MLGTKKFYYTVDTYNLDTREHKSIEQFKTNSVDQDDEVCFSNAYLKELCNEWNRVACLQARNKEARVLYRYFVTPEQFARNS